MDDLNVPAIDASPSISSVLKPPRPRIPLKELVLAANDEDNTAARKRRVSFANVNKIKEFSAGAESMVVCHTPAYEEPFSLSSDSSCPSGVDGWTPAKSDLHSSVQSTCFSAQKESDYEQPLFKPRMIGHCLTDSDVLASHSNLSPNVMDLTSCTNRGSLRNSTRFSVGMDFTEVIRSSMNDSGEGMDLSKGGACQSYQQHLYQTNINDSDGMLADDSDALELTDAVIDPRFSLASRYSVHNSNSTRNIYSVNNTRYSINGMDLTKAAMSPCSSVGRRSSRYSLSNMDLTEAVGNDYSGVEFTEVISEPKIVTTRYSANDMDLTEAIAQDNFTRLTVNSMDYTLPTGDKLECSITSGSNMDLTIPVFEVQQSAKTQVSDNVDLIEPVSNVGSRPFTCYSGNMDSLELNESNSETDDTPTTQTYNGTQPPPANKSATIGKDLTLQVEFSVEKKPSVEVDKGTSIKNKSLDCNVIQDEFPNQKSVAEASIAQLQSSDNSTSKEIHVHELNSIEIQKHNNISTNIDTEPFGNVDEITLHRSDDSKNDSEVEITMTNCENDDCLNIEKLSLNHKKRNQENNSCIVNDVTLQTNEMIEDEHITFVNDESMNLSEPLVLSYLPISRKSLHPVTVDQVGKNESRNEIVEMDVSILSPDKENTYKESPLLNGSLKQNKCSIDGGVVCTLFNSKTASQLALNDDDKMEVSFSETNSVKHVEDCPIKCSEQDCDTSLNSVENLVEDSKGNICASVELSKEFVTTGKVQHEYKSEHIISKTIHKADHEKSSDETIIEESTRQIDCLNNLTNSSDLILNISANSTLFGKNITLTRGGTSQNRTIRHDSTFETSNDDSIRAIEEQQSEMESSLPLIQRMEKLKKTVDITGDHSSVSQDEDRLCMKDKGGKRSFEVALEPENDTEESPVKQICLTNITHLPDSKCLDTVPPCLMDKSTELHNSVHSVHESQINKSVCNRTNLTQSALVDVNIERKDLSQNDHLIIKTRIALEQAVGQDHRNSVNVDVSTNYDISKTQGHVENKNYTQAEQIDDQIPVVCSQLKSLKPISDQPIDFVSSQSSLNYRQKLNGSSAIEQNLNFSNNIFLNNSLSKSIEAFKSHELKSNQLSTTPAVTLKTTNIFRKERSVRKLREGVFTYNLIPRWIEIEFNVEPSGIICNTSYKLICSDEDRAIGDYVLKQLSTLPEEQRSLTTVTEEPRDTFFLHLPKNLSFICKYYGGTLKGNILSLEIVSCNQKFWTFVDVNIKYPKYLSAEDITISEQRVGELKLSFVRQIFASVEGGHNQLLNFAAALNSLQC